MKISLRFGINEPQREVTWWNPVDKFYSLVTFKGRKWEFVMYEVDPVKIFDWILYFSEIKEGHVLYDRSKFEDISYMLDGIGDKCECGAAYTSFNQVHMFYCPKWSKR